MTQSAPNGRDPLPVAEAAPADFVPLVYEELRELANRYMAREPAGHTLQPTALVHDAYLRILAQDVTFSNRKSFLAAVAVTMRRILIERARRQKALKHGGGRFRIFLDQLSVDAEPGLDAIDLEEALVALSLVDPVKAAIVTLRYLLGSSIEETARVLAVSPAKVKRDWVFSRAWLRMKLVGKS